MLCGLSYLQESFSRGKRNGSSDGVGNASEKHALGNHHLSASPPPSKDEDREADRYAALSEVACPPPVENPDERRLYQKHYLEDRDGI